MYLPIELVLGLLLTTAAMFYFVTSLKWYWQVVVISCWLIGIFWIIKAAYLADAAEKVFV